jgi:hypothetical protein
MKEENKNLKSLVVKIVESVRTDDPAQLKVAIIEAASAAGLDITGLVGDESPSLSEDPEKPRTTVRSSAVKLPISQGSDTDTLAMSSVKLGMNTVVKSVEMLKCSPHNLVESATPQYYRASGCMSPRFDYGLWLDQDEFLKVYQPPTDIVPYVGISICTLAAHIMKACLVYAHTCLQNVDKKSIGTSLPSIQARYDYPPSLPYNTASRVFFDHGLRYSKPLHDVVLMAALVETRLDFFTLGYTRGDNQGVIEEYQQAIQEQVEAELSNCGVRRDQSWTALDVEVYVKERMGVCGFSKFQAALGREEEAHVQVLQPLVHDLARKCFCGGDGPRWKVENAIIAVNAWICGV